MKHCSVISKWNQIRCKGILETLGKYLKIKKGSITDMLRDERKLTDTKCSIKTREGRKRREIWGGGNKKKQRPSKTNRKQLQT